MKIMEIVYGPKSAEYYRRKKFEINDGDPIHETYINETLNAEELEEYGREIDEIDGNSESDKLSYDGWT